MPGEKTVAVSFRVSPRFKTLLEAAAAQEHRSQTNMLEVLVEDFCSRHGIHGAIAESTEVPAKSADEAA